MKSTGMERGGGTVTAPSYLELERAIASVPGVVEASVAVAPDTGRGRLRIRLAPGEDPETVSWAVAATLRERFGIALDPDDIRARPAAEDEAVSVPEEQDPVHLVADGTDEEDAPPAPERAAPERVSAAAGRDRLSDAAQAALDGLHGERGRARPSEREPATMARRADALFGTIVQEEPAPEEPAREAAAATDGAAATPAATPAPDTVDDASAVGRVRAEIRDLVVHHAPDAVEVTAMLRLADRDVREVARGVPTADGVLRAVAEATLRAVRMLCGRGVLAGVDAVAVRLAGDPPLAEVAVSILSDRGEERLVGAALVRGDVERAVMRATLDAVNRRLEPLLAAAEPG
jgi:hypothetical protein